MSTSLTIAARIEAKPDQVALVRGALLKLISPTRAEEGCLEYTLHQDNNNAAVFLFYETWSSRELWQQHMDSDHIATALGEIDGAVVSVDVAEMTRLEV